MVTGLPLEDVHIAVCMSLQAGLPVCLSVHITVLNGRKNLKFEIYHDISFQSLLRNVPRILIVS